MPTDSFDDYQSRALATAFHPQHLAVLYEAVGLTGEACEVAGVALSGLVGEQAGSDVVSELGDVCWYIAALADRIGVPLSQVAGTDDPSRFAADAVAADELTGVDADPLTAGAVQLTVLCGRVLETVKKAARGDDGPAALPLQLNATRAAAVSCLLTMALSRVACLAAVAGSDLAVVCDANLAKLARRHANGTLSGEGSDR